LVAALPLLQAGRYVSFLFLPAGEDPDTLVRKQGPAWFENDASFRQLAEVLFEHIGNEADVTSLNGRAKFVDTARPLLDQVPQGTYRRLLEQRLAETVQLPEPDVDSLRTQHPRRPMRLPIRADATRTEPSLVRVAISYLLHRPDLAPDLGDTSWLRQTPIAGAEILADLVDLLAKQPHLTGAALVERFRDRPFGEHLARLLAREMPTPVDGIVAELHASIERLKKAAQRSSYAPIPNDLPSKMSEREKEVYRKQIEDLAKRG
jgi:DNA primase